MELKTDLTALKFNQVTVVAVSALALAFHLPWLAGCLGLVMLIGAIWPARSPLRAAYRVLSTLLGLKPEIVQERPDAHHFAQGVGGSVLLLAGITGLLGLTVTSTTLGLLVIALALLNLTAKICVGCLMYFQWKMIRFRLAQVKR